VWIKRRWRCVDADCDAKTWTEHSDQVDAQAVLTRQAGAAACRQVGDEARPVARGTGRVDQERRSEMDRRHRGGGHRPGRVFRAVAQARSRRATTPPLQPAIALSRSSAAALGSSVRYTSLTDSFGQPPAQHFVVGIADAQTQQHSAPLVIETLVTGEEQLADAVERVGLAAPMASVSFCTRRRIFSRQRLATLTT
jgi:hypothetical protein